LSRHEYLARTIESRLSIGASQAAERIAWTPFSRKAIAIAVERAEEAASGRIACAKRAARSTGIALTEEILK
jgi:hypothetical protein